jgi:hypothetical protein
MKQLKLVNQINYNMMQHGCIYTSESLVDHSLEYLLEQLNPEIDPSSKLVIIVYIHSYRNENCFCLIFYNLH